MYINVKNNFVKKNIFFKNCEKNRQHTNQVLIYSTYEISPSSSGKFLANIFKYFESKDDSDFQLKLLEFQRRFYVIVICQNIGVGGFNPRELPPPNTLQPLAFLKHGNLFLCAKLRKPRPVYSVASLLIIETTTCRCFS